MMKRKQKIFAATVGSPATWNSNKPNVTLPATLTTHDGLKLAVKHWPLEAQQNQRGVVCLVHGLGEHIGRYEHVAASLNFAGWAAVGYDQRGHGLSDGVRGGIAHQDDPMQDVSVVIDAVKATYPKEPFAVLGHSMGGLIVARLVSALADPPEPRAWRRSVDLCLLSSPALKLPLSRIQKVLLNTVGRLLPSVKVNNGLKPEWLSSDLAAVRDYKRDPLVHDRVSGQLTRFMLESSEAIYQRASHWKTPTLLLYSGTDRCVDPEGSRRFAKELPAQLLVAKEYSNFKHEIFNERDNGEVLAELQNWLNHSDRTIA